MCRVPELVALVRCMEASAIAAPKCEHVSSASLSLGWRTVRVANSHAIAREFHAAYYQASITVQTRDSGDVCTGQASVFGRNLAAFEPEELGREAARQSAAKLGCRSIPGGKLPVILAPAASVQIVGAMIPMLIGSESAERSVAGNRLGQRVTSPLVTITDDPLRASIIGSAPFDGEGVVGEQTTLIRDGMLAGLLYNTRTARAVGLPRSTGSAARYAYRDLPSLGPSVLTLEPGGDSPEALVGSLEHGLLVTQLKGTSTGINLARGTFSVGLVGHIIRRGELAEPVAQIMAAGFLPQLLEDIDGVGNDLRYQGPIGSPSVRIASLRIVASSA